MAKQRRWRGSDVTVVTATIPGREAMLARASESVWGQNVPIAAHIVWEDVDRRGAWWARNQALKLVETPLIAWLDDDDEADSNHVAVLLRAANAHRDANMWFSYPRFPDSRDPLACCQNGRLVPAPVNVPFGRHQRDHLDARKGRLCPHCHYERGNFIPLGYLVETELVRDVGGFPEPYSLGEMTSGECEDYLMLLRMLDQRAMFHHVPAVTWTYHVHGANTGGRGADRMHELRHS